MLLNIENKDKDKIPKQPRPSSICCPSCGKDTGLQNPFMMVIPTNGICCTFCKSVVIQPNSIQFY